MALRKLRHISGLTACFFDYLLSSYIGLEPITVLKAEVAPL